MSYEKCRICQEWSWSITGAHVCPPEWEWRTDDTHGDDEWETVYALGAEAAAMKAAERYDEGDHPLLDPKARGHVVIFLRNERGDITRWRATAELIPHYRAEHIEPDAVSST